MGLLEISKKYGELSVIDCCSSCGNTGRYAGIEEAETVIRLAGDDQNLFDPGILSEYPSGKADLVLADCILYRLRDKQQVWNEIYRILKKGGRFIVSDLYTADASNPSGEYRPFSRHEYIDMLEKAGFSTLTIHEESPVSLRQEGMVAAWILSGEKPLAECDWCW